jgi:hypothetical protein
MKSRSRCGTERLSRTAMMSVSQAERGLLRQWHGRLLGRMKIRDSPSAG